MEKKNLQTKRVKLAQVRYFDKKHNGVDIPALKAYVFLYKVGDAFMNILNPGWDLPVYDRVPYSNTTKDGIVFGTKIILACGEEKNGPCYVIENIGMDHIFGEEEIPMSQLEDFVMKSNLFFIDRLSLVKEKKVFPLNQKLRDDVKKQELFQRYLDVSQQLENNCK